MAAHALAWLALAGRQVRHALTSDEVAASVNTNPVVVRRCLGELRRAGLVGVRHGAGAGWWLARAAGEITLLDVYRAVEQKPLFGLHHGEPNLECPVGRGIRPALTEVYGGVERAVEHELGRTSIADVLERTLGERR